MTRTLKEQSFHWILVKTKLVNVLDEIEDLSEFYFLYNEKLVDTNREVTVAAKDENIEEVLDALFRGTNVKYTIADRKIILSPSSAIQGQQQRTISGKVTDEDRSVAAWC